MTSLRNFLEHFIVSPIVSLFDAQHRRTIDMWQRQRVPQDLSWAQLAPVIEPFHRQQQQRSETRLKRLDPEVRLRLYQHFAEKNRLKNKSASPQQQNLSQEKSMVGDGNDLWLLAMNTQTGLTHRQQRAQQVVAAQNQQAAND